MGVRKRGVLLLICACYGCATTGPLHGSGESVFWSLSRASSPQGSATEVCQSDKPAPCILERSTPDRTSYARFTLHVFGPKATGFRGSILISYLEDPDPRRYKSDVHLTSNNQEVHQHIFSRVTTMPGQYSVRIHLEETGPASPEPRLHDLVIMVTIR
jgi:hypothetical protein